MTNYFPSSSTIRAAALMLCLSAGTTFASTGAPWLVAQDDDAGLSLVDARLTAAGTPTAQVQQAIADARAGIANAHDAALARLGNQVPLVAVDDDEFFGTPHFVRSTVAFLTGPSQLAPTDIATAFVREYRDLFEIDPAELAAAKVTRNFVTTHNGAQHLTLQQQVNGIDLYGCEVRANVTRDGRLINISSSMLPRPAGDFAVPAPVISDQAALLAAASDAGITISAPPASAPIAEGPTQKRTWTTPDLRADEPVVTELVYFPVTRTDIRTAWTVVIPVKGSVGHTYDYIIDSADGTVLRREDRLRYSSTQPITMRVYTSNSPAPLASPGLASPNGYQAPFVPRTLVTINPSDVAAWSPNGWINDGDMETLGNNVDAHLDLNDDNIADTPRPNGGASRVFDFPLDVTQAPSTYQSASVTELFYRANWYHDRLYALGFDEAAGNFQTTNFSGRGVGNDPIQADCQNGASLGRADNANFNTTGSDGSTGRVQMYLWTDLTPARDGSLDGDIVYHELTHGTSIRLLHGLGMSAQPGGLGEGWSDLVATMLQAQSTDDPDGRYPSGCYALYLAGGTFVDNYYYGVRRYPYCTDLTKNPLTFKDIDPSQADPHASVPMSPRLIGPPAPPADEPHDAGEVWCNTALEARAALWHVYGFAGNQRMLQLVIDGMKLTPASPTFLQARDGILQADLVDYNNADLTTLWTAFARRGMGYGAVAPVSSTNTGVTESFNVPPLALFSYPDGRPTQLTPGQAASFHVDVAPFGLTLVDNTVQIHYSINGASFVAAALPESAPGSNHYTVTLPALSCNQGVRFYFTTQTSAGDRSDPAVTPPAAGDTTYSADVFTSTSTFLNESFETGTNGWTATITRTPGAVGTLTGLWERAIPVGTLAAPGAAHSGQYCYVTENGPVGGALSDHDVDNGTTTLLSPAFDLSTFADASISYWRWYSNGTGSSPHSDVFTIDVSTDNGATWHNAETIGPAGVGVDGGWINASWSLSSLGLLPTNTVRVRFVVGDLGGASVVEGGLDDFVITARTCTPPSTCGSADFNCDGDIATDADIEAFFACIAGTCPPPPCTSTADFNGDGDYATDADIEAFFRVLAGGTC
jgi:hypothetical protein